MEIYQGDSAVHVLLFYFLYGCRNLAAKPRRTEFGQGLYLSCTYSSSSANQSLALTQK